MFDLGLASEKWPIRTPPQDDELLSSWLARLAMNHGLKLHTLGTLIWGNRSGWNRDIDKSVDSEALHELARKSGVSFEQAYQTSLISYEGVIYETHNRYGPNPWIMPIGIFHRKRTKFGLQYCPHCLAGDTVAYYRRRWRLAFITICDRHRILLQDRCPACGSLVNFHRTELGNFRMRMAESLTKCYVCGFDLRTPSKSEANCLVNSDEVSFSAKLVSSLKSGWIQLNADTIVY